MSEYLPIKGYIYLVKMFDTSNNIIIYKVGKSINFYKRYKIYNYAEILNFISSSDINKDETEIIKLFNKNCKLDKGREFFTADSDYFVLDIFMEYFYTKNKLNIKSNKIDKIDKNILEEQILDKKILEEQIVIKKDIINNTIIYNSNCDKTCPTCKIVFKYPSRLKTHFQLTIHCKKSSDEITNYFENIAKQKARCLTSNNIITNTSSTNTSPTIFNCEQCNNTYTFIHNLNRHKKNSKCSRRNNNNNNSNNNNNDNSNSNNSINIIKNKLLSNIETIKMVISKLNVNN